MRSRSIVSRLALSAVLAVPFAGVGATITARAAGAASVPSAPRSVSGVQKGSGGAKVTWKAPLNNGGSAITAYVITPFKAGVAQPAITFKSAKTTQTLNGLPNGKSYRFKVAARNAAGKGAASALSGAIVIGAPGLTTIGSHAILSPGVLRLGPVKWGAANGALPFRMDATCTSTNGGATRTGVRQPIILPTIVVSGLTIGKTYRCTATTTNSRGTGLRSKPTPAIAM